MPKDNKAFRRTSGQEAQFDLILKRLHCMAEGGSRSSKTFGWCYSIAVRAMYAPSTHLIVRRYYKDCRQSIAVGERATFPQMMSLVFPDIPFETNHTDWTITLPPHGSTIWLAGMDTGGRMDKCLGREYSTIFLNETSEMPYDSVLTLRSRLAEKSGLALRMLYDQNPPTKSHWTFKEFHEGIDPNTRDRKIDRWKELYGALQINPECNRGNIADGYIETILAGLPDRQRRRFLDGQYTDDVEGALWSQTDIDHYRVSECPPLVRIVVGVDPSVKNRGSSHECGIVAVGKGVDGHLYPVEDRSIKAHCTVWGGVVITLYGDLKANLIVGEVNQGGDLVENNIHTCEGGSNLPFKAVTATDGKRKRAEPIANLYRRGMVHHVGTHRYLEDEMTTYDPNKVEDENNPANRMDALVWACTELSGFEGLAASDALAQMASSRRRA